jgi:RNA polymerase sigma-70 factor (ECF subfamily)
MTSETITSAYREESDSKLVAEIRNGEGQAFEFLVKRHEAKMLAVAFRITRNREDAEDVVQQGFHKAFMHLGRFQGKSSFSTWLTRIVINEALMRLRRNRALREISLGDVQAEPNSVSVTEIPDRGENPAEIYEHQEKERILSQAMNHLSAEFRTALQLRLEEQTVGETAEILGLGITTLKARLFRGRQKLRVLLTSGPEFRRGPAIRRMRKGLETDVNSHLPISAVSCG